MEKAFLERCLEEGMSSARIGEAAGRDASTVRYWMRKHGLTPNGSSRHTPRGAIAREELEPLVARGLTYAEIGRRLDRGPSSVRYWVHEHCLEPPIKVRNADRDVRIAAGQRTVDRHCRHHGLTEFVIQRDGRTRCRKCRAQRVAQWRRRTKLTLIEEAGGECAACGYDDFPGALEFHHRDPREKSFGLAAAGRARSIDKLRAEAAKCVLLCANCHAEVEGGVRELPLE